jgi:NAD/NADP transhydrogenase alpha subunit
MFAKNVLALVTHLAPEGTLRVDPADEIAGPMTVVRDGQVVIRAVP